ncbi:hypothetical protein BKA70DRAFT_648315 [Coprinopsis sp. MPI-PUGE-AT-0042]|nr:hypothetical protein BKA70DRAFT_648315 [Coprinopsis sp. MPI-PUGE-AT-0042]
MFSPTTTLRAPAQTSGSCSLSDLPAELSIKVLQFALRRCKPWVLASLSKSYRNHVYDIIYSVVALDSEKKIGRFHAISRTNPQVLLYTRKLVIIDGDWAGYDDAPSKIFSIISACAAIRILEVPTLEYIPPALSKATHPELVEVTTAEARRAFGFSGRAIALRSLGLERLRIAGHALGFGPFIRPSVILSEFDNPPELTHLELSRLANSNQDNDAIFVRDVVEVLQSGSFPKLKMLVVSIIGVDAKGSDVWKLVEEVGTADSRLVLVEGRGVGDDRKDFDFTLALDLRSKFWTR